MGRARDGGVKLHTAVHVPLDAFPVSDLFAQHPDDEHPHWRPETVHYRAVAAGYHRGERATSGHYWAIVRGTEPHAGGQAAEGMRLCNDAFVLADIPADRCWTSAAAATRVTWVLLERVGPGALDAPTPSLRLNSFMPPAAAPAAGVQRECAFCTLICPARAQTCPACRNPLAPVRIGGRPAGGRVGRR